MLDGVALNQGDYTGFLFFSTEIFRVYNVSVSPHASRNRRQNSGKVLWPTAQRWWFALT